MGKFTKLFVIMLIGAIAISGCRKDDPDETADVPTVPGTTTVPGVPAPTDVVERDYEEGRAPNFTLTDHLGNEHTLTDYLNKIVVLEWINPECPFVVRHFDKNTMIDLANDYADEGVVWLAVNSTSHFTTEMNANMVEEHGLPYVVLDDRDGTVGRLYNAQRTPEMYIIDRDGRLVYQGAIDNDPRGNKDEDDIVNYVRVALDELLAGEEVSTPETTAYGCTVKYAD